MEYSQLVSKLKEGMSSLASPSSGLPLSSLVSSSAYDTAWVAMVPDPDHPGLPMFPRCVHWVRRNQRRRGGFWGHTDHRGHPTLDTLTATAACLAALKTWDAAAAAHDPHRIEQGLDFLHSRTADLLAAHYNADGTGAVPRWFAIAFPGMLEVAASLGLDVFRGGFFQVVAAVFEQRRRILADEGHGGARVRGDRYCCSPLVSYLEVLPAEFNAFGSIEGVVASNQSADGSLFQSPSATAFAFMATGNGSCRAYLEALVADSSLGVASPGVGVPAAYPVDEQLPRLVMVDTLERLGISEHFVGEVADMMRCIHSYWTREQDPQNHNINGSRENNSTPLQLYQDALAFSLLRRHGYQVSPERLCWFLHDDAAKGEIEENSGRYLSAMLNVYRATHVGFPGEEDLEEAKKYSKRLLHKGTSSSTHLSANWEDGVVVDTDFQIEVSHELELPWLGRMDHLENRRFIEMSGNHSLWVAKASFFRFSCIDDDAMLRLAVKSFDVRQCVYKDELDELQMWSRSMGLSGIGFGREKTTYLYFAAAVSSHLPLTSEVRNVITKCAVLVTVADDFYDMEGSLEELQALTDAVQRWDGSNLFGHGKIIFQALCLLVEDLHMKYVKLYGCDLRDVLYDIWRETFGSWMKEAEWSRHRHAPQVDEYMKVGMISIAIQVMVLPACYLLNPRPALDNNSTRSHYLQITRHLMVLARLLNDMQSHKKECQEGKMNMVTLLQNIEGSTAVLDIDASMALVNNIVEATKKAFLEIALVGGSAASIDHVVVPMEWKKLHIYALKSFQMFFNGENAFDSPTALLHNISMAIYEPLTVESWSHQELDANLDRGEEVEDQASSGGIVDTVDGWLLGQDRQLLMAKKLTATRKVRSWEEKDGFAGHGEPRPKRNLMRTPWPQQFWWPTKASAVPAYPKLYQLPFLRCFGNPKFVRAQYSILV